MLRFGSPTVEGSRARRKNTQTASVWKTTNTTYWMTFPWGARCFGAFSSACALVRTRVCVRLCLFKWNWNFLMDLTRHQLSEGRANIKKKLFSLPWNVFSVFSFLGMPSRSCSSYHIAFILSYNRIIRAAVRLWNRYEITLITFEFIGFLFLRFGSVKKLLSLSHSCPFVHIPFFFFRVISFHFFRLLCAIRWLVLDIICLLFSGNDEWRLQRVRDEDLKLPGTEEEREGKKCKQKQDLLSAYSSSSSSSVKEASSHLWTGFRLARAL